MPPLIERFHKIQLGIVIQYLILNKLMRNDLFIFKKILIINKPVMITKSIHERIQSWQRYF